MTTARAGQIITPGGRFAATVRGLQAGLVSGMGLPTIATFSDGSGDNMGVDGSGSPVVFAATALPGVRAAIHRITLTLGYSPGNGDTYSGTDFGTIGGVLSNGLRLTYAATASDSDWDVLAGITLRQSGHLSQSGADVEWIPSVSGTGILRAVWDCERCFGGPLVITDGGSVKWWVEDDLSSMSGYIGATGTARTVV